MWKKEQLNNDSISEKYRKYVIGIRYSRKIQYALWGTDLSTKDETDKLWLDQNGDILLFNSIGTLRANALSYKHVLFDEVNFLKWAEKHMHTQAYTYYNLDHVIHAAALPNLLKDMKPKDGIEVVNFINIFNDYAKQVDNEDLLKCYEDKNVSTFFDYVYDNYVWNLPEHRGYHSLNELDYLRFDEEKFREQVQRMLKLFMDNTVVWNG